MKNLGNKKLKNINDEGSRKLWRVEERKVKKKNETKKKIVTI